MIIKSGIDTISKKYIKNPDIKNGIYLTSDIIPGKIWERNNMITVSLKPSKGRINKLPLSYESSLSNLKETVDKTSNLDKTNGQRGEIVRADIAADLKEDMRQNKNRHRLFLECMRFMKNGEKLTFKTIQGIGIEGNLKIKTPRGELVIYNCSDKKRAGATRIENRILKIPKNTDDKQILVQEIKNYIKDLDGVEQYIPIINDFYSKALIEGFYEQLAVNKFTHIKNYLFWADKEGYLLTKNILEEFLIGVEYKHDISNFITHQRRGTKDVFKFTNKTKLKKFVGDLKKSLKNSIKE